MKFSIVTPCWNASHLIRDTVTSVASQTVLNHGDVELEYIVVDGASMDGTTALAEQAWVQHPRSSLRIISEPDEGMYDALSKGLAVVTGDVVAYLNAGDYYSPHCLEVVRTCVDTFGMSWLTGMRVTYSPEGALVSAKVPFRYRRDLIRSGHYGIRGAGRFIQQESTFWTKAVLNSADLDRLRSFKLAGDLFLWTEFARTTELEIVAAHLGGFRFHGDHLSEAMESYKAEAREFIDRPRLTGYLRAPADEVLSWLPVPIRRVVPGRHPVVAWDRHHGGWRIN